MSETCIVCLGDLSCGIGAAAAVPIADAKSPPRLDDEPGNGNGNGNGKGNDGSIATHDIANLVAQIQECGHLFHQACLEPWTKRANSCPMCRANFHHVEIKQSVGGLTLSTLHVEDRRQVAELDPATVFELIDDDEDDEGDQPCQGCGEGDNEDVLLICENCDKMWHTYCVGLQEVPLGLWFCESCHSLSASDNWRRSQPHQRRARTAGRLIAAHQRRPRTTGDQLDDSWNQVWGHVWTSINLDLDFPYNDDDATAAHIRRDRQRRMRNNRDAHGAFERRMEIARFAGVDNSFRQAASAFANNGAHRAIRALRNNLPSPRHRVMDQEEASAWAAFDQARAASAEPPPTRRPKRKSESNSPAVRGGAEEEVEEDEGEEGTSTARPVVIKRRRTSQSAAPAPIGSGSRSRLRRSPSRLSPPRLSALTDAAGPSFLQSLLQEVEESSHASSRVTSHRPLTRAAVSPAEQMTSPRPSSPAHSPSSSNHSSPRALSTTPPPLGTSRSVSPVGLSSTLQPIYSTIEALARGHSPSPKPNGVPNGVPDGNNSHTNNHNHTSSNSNSNRDRHQAPTANGLLIVQPKPRSRLPPFIKTTPPPAPAPPTMSPVEGSPSRARMSLSAKSNVQKLVSNALNPHYNDQTISKDEYTTINRDISRMLYDRIGDFDTMDTVDRAKWEQVAHAEVEKAVTSLRASA